MKCLSHEVFKDGDGWFGDVKLLNSHINLDWVHGSLRLYDLYGDSGGFLVLKYQVYEKQCIYLMKKRHEYVEMSQGVAEPSPKTLDLFCLLNA